MQILNDITLSEILWYKIGGKAKYILECSSKEDVFEAIAFIQKNKISRVFTCGIGANLVFTDGYFDGAVIRMMPSNTPLTVSDDKFIEAFGGDILDTVITTGFAHNLVGLSWAGGLPGTVGAAVRGNVGAFGGEVKDVIDSAEVVYFDEHDIQVTTFSNNALAFAYRSSYIKTNKNHIVLSAKFLLQKTDTTGMEKAKEEYMKRITYRKEHHPLEYPNTGSVFKNIKDSEQVEKVLSIFPDIKENVENKWYGKVAAGYLIDRLGLSEYRVGNAQISKKHALFIVNLGGAKAADVLAVIEKIQSTFQKTFGFRLEPEVEIVQ